MSKDIIKKNRNPCNPLYISEIRGSKNCHPWEISVVAGIRGNSLKTTRHTMISLFAQISVPCIWRFTEFVVSLQTIQQANYTP